VAYGVDEGGVVGLSVAAAGVGGAVVAHRGAGVLEVVAHGGDPSAELLGDLPDGELVLEVEALGLGEGERARRAASGGLSAHAAGSRGGVGGPRGLPHPGAALRLGARDGTGHGGGLGCRRGGLGGEEIGEECCHGDLVYGLGGRVQCDDASDLGPDGGGRRSRSGGSRYRLDHVGAIRGSRFRGLRGLGRCGEACGDVFGVELEVVAVAGGGDIRVSRIHEFVASAAGAEAGAVDLPRFGLAAGARGGELVPVEAGGLWLLLGVGVAVEDVVGEARGDGAAACDVVHGVAGDHQNSAPSAVARVSQGRTRSRCVTAAVIWSSPAGVVWSR